MAAQRVDRRVLGAGTTVRFGLLVVLLVAASAAGISDVLGWITDPNSNANGCELASGWNPNSGYLPELARSFATQGTAPAQSACLARYSPSAPWWVLIAGIGLVFVVAAAFFWGIPAWKGRRGQVVPVRDVDERGDLEPALAQLTLAAGLDRARFVINPGRVTTNAVVFGRPGRHTVCLDGGLVARRQADPSGFRAVVLHELAHIRNGDVSITYATVALWRAFLLVVLAPEAVLLGWELIVQDPHSVVAPVDRPTTVYALLLLAALAALVYLTRADILRSREIYADLDALAWGADSGHWSHRRTADRTASRRRLVAFRELWRTHPRWDQRRQSLTDPVALFGIQPLPAFLTGAATIILNAQVTASLPPLSSGTRDVLDGLTAWLVAVLITVIIGTAVWRAVAYAVLTGRRPPSGVLTGLWLGAGLAVGDWLLDSTDEGQWLPNHPAVLVVHLLVAMVITWWTAQAAELIIRRWRGRTLRPAMFLGLVVPWLAFTFWLAWWQSTGNLFVGGWPVDWEQFMGLATSHSGVIALLSLVMGVLTAVHVNPLAVWVVTAMWLVPLLAWTVRPPTQLPRWLRAALPDEVDPPLPAEPLPALRRPLRVALLGGTLGAIAVAAVMAYLHTRRPPAHQTNDLWLFLDVTLLTLALVVAPVTAAGVAASITRRYRLLMAWAAAGVAALVACAAGYLVSGAQECLGPLNTTASVSCHWRPLLAWPIYAQSLMPPVLETGMFLAAVVALLVEAVRHLAQLGRPAGSARPSRSLPPPQARWAAKRVGIAAICVAAVGLIVGGVVLPGLGSTSTDTSDQVFLAPAATPVTSEVRRTQMLAWVKFGGEDLIGQFLNTDIPKLDAAVKAPIVDSDKVGLACTEINQTKRVANAYFPMPDPALQKDWSVAITQLTQACGDFQRAVLQADDNLFDTAANEYLSVAKGIDSLTTKIDSELQGS